MVYTVRAVHTAAAVSSVNYLHPHHLLSQVTSNPYTVNSSLVLPTKLSTHRNLAIPRTWFNSLVIRIICSTGLNVLCWAPLRASHISTSTPLAAMKQVDAVLYIAQQAGWDTHVQAGWVHSELVVRLEG